MRDGKPITVAAVLHLAKSSHDKQEKRGTWSNCEAGGNIKACLTSAILSFPSRVGWVPAETPSSCCLPYGAFVHKTHTVVFVWKSPTQGT